jgi:hypothetical protein
MFTARNMNLQSDPAAGELRGDYTVPSYRGATFMDPKVGGGGGGGGGVRPASGLEAAGCGWGDAILLKILRVTLLL